VSFVDWVKPVRYPTTFLIPKDVIIHQVILKILEKEQPMNVTKIFRFEACHSVKDAYTDRCDRMRGGLHGHSYVVELTLAGDVQSDGMVMDFSLLKEKFNHIIDAFDHSFVVNSEDQVMTVLGPYLSARYILFPGNPTAENMAQYFFDYIHEALKSCFPGVFVYSVVVWETVTGKATCLSGSVKSTSPLSVSYAIAENWKETELDTFTSNNGTLLHKSALFSDIKIIEVLHGDPSTFTFQASVKNCK
jgi:6-pyruvoyltetrahydropterin/6-carboxytetrahydropterin synthase